MPSKKPSTKQTPSHPTLPPAYTVLKQVADIWRSIGAPFVEATGTATKGSMRIVVPPRRGSQADSTTVTNTPSMNRREDMIRLRQSIAALKRRGLKKRQVGEILRCLQEFDLMARGGSEWLSHRSEDIIRSLERAKREWRTLHRQLQKIQAPLMVVKVRKAFESRYATAVEALDQALSKARQADALLKEARTRFVSRRSPSKKEAERRIMHLIVSGTGVSRNHASYLAAELIKPMDPDRAPMASTLRIRSYDKEL